MVLAHLLGLALLLIPPVGGVLGPGVLWWFNRKSNPSVEREARKSVNFQIAFLFVFVLLLVMQLGADLVGKVIGFLGVIAAYLLMTASVAALIANVAFVAIAALKAGSGETTKYPVRYDFLKHIERLLERER
jgi:uncharacterized Tic20 family protein